MTSPKSDKNTKHDDYYAILELEPTASIEEIRKNYRRLALQVHPDKDHRNPAATAAFQRLQHAHEVLSDEVKRLEFNRGYWKRRKAAKDEEERLRKERRRSGDKTATATATAAAAAATTSADARGKAQSKKQQQQQGQREYRRQEHQSHQQTQRDQARAHFKTTQTQENRTDEFAFGLLNKTYNELSSNVLNLQNEAHRLRSQRTSLATSINDVHVAVNRAVEASHRREQVLNRTVRTIFVPRKIASQHEQARSKASEELQRTLSMLGREAEDTEAAILQTQKAISETHRAMAGNRKTANAVKERIRQRATAWEKEWWRTATPDERTKKTAEEEARKRAQQLAYTEAEAQRSRDDAARRAKEHDEQMKRLREEQERRRNYNPMIPSSRY